MISFFWFNCTLNSIISHIDNCSLFKLSRNKKCSRTKTTTKIQNKTKCSRTKTTKNVQKQKQQQKLKNKKIVQEPAKS